MSQRQLARAAKISNSYIALIETGERGEKASRDTILALASALNVHPYQLLKAAGRDTPDDNPKRPPAEPTFHQIVRRDPLLREQERDMLIQLYETYVSPRRGGRS